MGNKKNDIRIIALKMLKAAVDIDESLVKILKSQIKRLGQMAKGKTDVEELQKINALIKNIIIALCLAEEKIKTGMELYLSDRADDKHKPRK